MKPGSSEHKLDPSLVLCEATMETRWWLVSDTQEKPDCSFQAVQPAKGHGGPPKSFQQWGMATLLRQPPGSPMFICRHSAAVPLSHPRGPCSASVSPFLSVYFLSACVLSSTVSVECIIFAAMILQNRYLAISIYSLKCRLLFL